MAHSGLIHNSFKIKCLFLLISHRHSNEVVHSSSRQLLKWFWIMEKYFHPNWSRKVALIMVEFCWHRKNCIQGKDILLNFGKEKILFVNTQLSTKKFKEHTEKQKKRSGSFPNIKGEENFKTVKIFFRGTSWRYGLKVSTV